ncbi:peptidylprolyl isomerase [Parabacteroides sp. PF5-9]|uniref:peptidylprolyl isomerase n=1 Tax=Parabacteroides sp. PF5-9 TaxID=1742404 RepID=UPI002474E177|nr:peptidylprolyl isomerase [Parabacteroides sp. PF5-9]MDH6357990.1 peptidyl-prolyl cis-trans isomerase D [Parabacteroides sp. PF5-9]
MATLEKIRSKAGLLVIVVGVALFAFIIGDFLNSGSTYFRQSQEKIASIDGEVINIQDYQLRIDEMSEVYKMQSGSANLSEEITAQIRQSVFDSMVQEFVLNKATEELGLTVGPEELFDMVQGENISPMIQQMQLFTDPQTGAFDKTALLNFLKAIDDDNISSYPAEQQAQLLQARSFWLFWEKNIKLQRLEQKYTTLLSKAVSANTLEAKDAFNASTGSKDIVFAMQTYNSIPDSTIQVSKGEIEKIYNQRKELYKQKESKVIDYISVDINPSQDDYNKVQAEIEEIKKELASSDRIAEIVNENSEVPYIDAFFSENAFDAELKQFATSAEIGAIEGPFFSNNKYRLFKLVDKTVAPDSVFVSHIMLAGLTEARTTALADSLKNVLKTGADFAELARQFSMDQAAQAGGELGWFTEATALRGINEEFKKTVFSTPINEIAVVKSLYGTHLVKVTEKTANVTKYKVADVDLTVSPSSTTFSNIYNDLNQFISTNNTIAKINENAQGAGYNVTKDVTITASDQTLAMISNSRQVIRWAFQNEKGAISDIFEVGNRFIVAAVQGTIPEGYRSLANVTPTIQTELIAQKKGEKIANELKSKNLSSVSAYAQAMGSAVDSAKFVTFETRRITGIGVEPKVNAYVASSQTGQTSEPIIGNNGVYVVQTYAVNNDNKEYNETQQVGALNQMNEYRYGFQAVQSLINKAKVEDNRIRFY